MKSAERIPLDLVSGTWPEPEQRVVLALEIPEQLDPQGWFTVDNDGAEVVLVPDPAAPPPASGAPLDPAAAVRLSARYADLVVAGQPEAEDEGELRGLADELTLSAGRPVLFVPYAGKFEKVGERVLVAWDGGREAARAVSDALPFLQRAKAVEVAVFDPERSSRHGQEPGADIGLYLSRHGIKVQVARQSGAGFDVGAQILSRAADTSADLIVMGGYGHARVRELVLGGVTRSLLQAMTVPVLMSH